MSDFKNPDDVQNPPSLSADPTNRVERNKPKVKAPFKDVPMGRFMRYLIGGVLAIVAFYVWRMTVWASDAGGYWNLMTGRRAAPADDPANIAKMAASIKASEASAVKSANADSKSAVGGAGGAGGAGKKKMKKESIESQITRLAASLGISPADLTAAIRPYLDPTVPNPNDAGAGAAAAAAAAAASAKEEKAPEPGLLDVVGEILLD